ncbi:head scaffolding protein [Agrobacterium phage Atu_ph02]|uniref:Uncharacterized protein n=1 Tax=Agrobacterium phage Atu_ph02 TaxID=2024261 RepID=A0A2L0UYY8_9CAUD|nr:head scaffolding protein [Agrobacterium phage Atu_ph02]AUZ94743.1 hypothetical protein [Agrobacterium phage Atu_ph02]
MSEDTTKTSAAADAVQGANPEDLSGRQSHVGSPQPEDKGRAKPLTPEEIKAKQGLADDPDEDAAAKAAKAKEGVEPEVEEEEEDQKAWEGEYLQFNDEAADSVVDLLKEAGVGAREANLIFKDAIEADDIGKIKWDVLKERLGPAKARLAQVAITDYHNRVYSRNVATTKMVHAEVGGEKNWQKVAKWVRAQEAADPTKKGVFDEIRKGIDAGGKLASYAIKELKELYQADGRNSGLGNGTVQRGTGRSQDNPHGEPLSRAAYMEAMKAAQKARAKPAEINALRARREAGRKQGI